MQTYSLDLTGYRCPIPLLMAKQNFVNCSSPSRFCLLINEESHSDIKQLCESLTIEILDENQEDKQVKIWVEIK